MDTSHLMIRMKNFVKSSESSSTSNVANEKLNNLPIPLPVSGKTVKQFYENTLGEQALVSKPIVKKQSDKLIRKKKTETDYVKKPFNINLFMKAVENGCFKDVLAVLGSDSKFVNCQDQYGWTPLMTACCAGNLPMVKLLLKWKPEMKKRDKKGNTCRGLALSRGHKDIVNALDDYNKPTIKQNTRDCDDRKLDVPFYCEVCKQTVENSSFKKHLSSTIHNFNTSSQRRMPTMYGIPESNKGFQILVKSGWDKEHGLGPSGEGQKFPPKTILKQDKTGLGAKKYKARITHSLEDVRRDAKPKETFKRNLKLQISKDKRHERNLRRMLS